MISYANTLVQMTSSSPQKVPCRICADESSGRYYGYHLCASCKAFFRRNADKKEKFICTFNNNCEMNKITRRHCRKCRLDKCFAIGMKREWIQFDDKTIDGGNDGEPIPGTSGYIGTISTQQQVVHPSESADDEDENESRANLSSVFDDLLNDQALHGLLEDVDEQTSTMIKNENDNQQQLAMETDTILQLCSQCPDFDDSPWNTCDDSCCFHKVHQEYLTSTSYVRNCDNQVCAGISKQPNQCDEKPWTWKMHHLMIASNFMPLSFRTELTSPRVTLNHLEQEKLDELSTFSSSICEICPTQFPEILDVPGFLKIVDCCLNRLIPSLNTVSTFASLSMEDRMYLIKRNFADILLFRATVLIDIQTESFQIPKTPMVLQLNGLRTVTNSIFNAYMGFMKSLRPNWRTDTKANMLVLAIMLFNPETPNLLNPDIIRLHQFNYVYLLKRYLEFRCFIFCHARCDFYDLMMKIGEFQETINCREFIYEMAFNYREAVGPLLSELLDLP